VRPRPTVRSFRALLAAIAAVGTLHGLLYVPFVSSHLGTDSATYKAAAHALLHGGYSTPLIAGFYYTDPIGLFDITGLEIDRAAYNAPERQAFRPPGYPVFLALLGGGGDGLSLDLVLGAQALLFGLGVLVLGFTVRRWWGPGPALAAAALYALDPYSKRYVTLVLTEVVAGLVALCAAYAFTRAWQERAARWWAAAGALAAALTLVRAVFVLAVPLLVLAALLRSGDVRARLGAAALTLVCAAALLVPWLAWTDAVTGRAVLASWGEGYNLLVAAHGEGLGRTATDVANDPAFIRDYNSTRGLAPSTERLLSDPEAHPRYMRRADATLRRLARAEYRDRVAHEPLDVAGETLYRGYFLWTAHEDWYQPGGAALLLLKLVDWITLALALVGLALALARGGPARGVAIFLLVYTAVLATHHVEARFGMPVRGLLLAYAALALAESPAATWARRRLERRRAGTRTARTETSPGSRPTSRTTA
jgi:4-amino-4-deoxy-L-arabinose transferase-like glycosyltransferase